MVRFGRAAIKRTLSLGNRGGRMHAGSSWSASRRECDDFSHQSQMQTINEGPRESWGTLLGYLVVTASEELQQTEAVAERIGH
jgi:hypothetical protein